MICRLCLPHACQPKVPKKEVPHVFIMCLERGACPMLPGWPPFVSRSQSTLWVIPAHAGPGLTLRLALATATLANKPEEAEKVPAHWGLLSCCPGMQGICM